MVLKSVEDVLLQEVAKAFKELTTSILVHLQTTSSSSSTGACKPQRSDRLLLERLLLLHCRSELLLADFSEYYCSRLLLDIRSPHATYFIDLFHQLEWLLEALVLLRLGHSEDDERMSRLPQDLYLKTSTLLRCIRPAVSSCRFLSLHSQLFCPDGLFLAERASEIATDLLECSCRGRELDIDFIKCLEELEELDELKIRTQENLKARILRRLKEILTGQKLDQIMRKRIAQMESERPQLQIIKRAKRFEICWRRCIRWMPVKMLHLSRIAKANRDLPMDSFQARLKLLPFGNLDKYSPYSRVELGAELGEGSFAVVYEGKFMTQKHGDKTQQTVGQPVAVKVFRNGLRYSYSRESGGSTIHTGDLGSRFFNQMELIGKLKEKFHSQMLSLKENVQFSTSGFTITECSKLSFSVQGTASHDSFDQMEKKIAHGELSDELWKLVTAKHPNIVSALGYIGKRDEGESGLVMELMSTNLHIYLKEVAEPHLQELEMVDLMLEIAKGMRFLHESDLVHRDLKPQNVLLRFDKQLMTNRRWSMREGGRAMEVKLADFGLAQRLVCMKRDALQGLESDSCEVAGTYCYMAPELLQGSQMKPRSENKASLLPRTSNSKDKMDVFSYGTTCFNILTCYKDAGALNDLTCKARSKVSAAPFYEAVKSNEWRALVKGKPEYLIDLIAKCWALDPSQRPTFAEICYLLQRALLCILAPPVIDEQALVKALSRNVLGDVLRPIMESSNMGHEVIGISLLKKSRRDFAGLIDFSIISQHLAGSRPVNIFLGDLWNCATSLQKQWSCKHGMMNVNAKSVKASVLVLQQQHQEKPQRNVRAQKFLQIPFTTMDLNWDLFKVLVLCSIFSHFLPTDGSVHWSSRPNLKQHNRLDDGFPFENDKLDDEFELDLFPFENDAAKTGLDVDLSLMPFLGCFWESGYLRPLGPLLERDSKP